MDSQYNEKIPPGQVELVVPEVQLHPVHSIVAKPHIVSAPAQLKYVKKKDKKYKNLRIKSTLSLLAHISTILKRYKKKSF